MRKFYTVLAFFAFFVSQSLAQTNQIFFDDFEQGAFKPEWTINPGAPNGVIEVFAAPAHQGKYGVRMGKTTDGEYATNQLDLQLDLSAYKEVDLSFLIYDNFDETQEQDGIFFSDDGGKSFRKVCSFDPTHWADKIYGQLPPLDVDFLAAKYGLKLTHNFIIRFQQHGKDDFNGSADYSDGIFLDNILVSSSELTYATLPFTDDFEAEKLGSMWQWGDPARSNVPVATAPTGVMKLVPDPKAYQGQVVAFGSKIDKMPVTNALDLHLNLAGHEQVALRFMIYDNADETHKQDGIFFSDDGGRRFVKVFDFNPEGWADGLWGQLPPLDVDRLVVKHGLQLTAQFVIRFQQHDDDDFEGSRNMADGMYLDDVSVTVPEITYATLPFTDDFEAEKLGSMWQWGDPARSNVPTVISTTGVVKLMAGPEGHTSQVVGLGSRVDKIENTNALDLHLNLAEHSQVALNFDFYVNFEEMHEQDGIFFSDNGGESFKKVLAFDFDNWSAKCFGQFPSINVDQLAAKHGLQLTNRFIIRFQQHDDDDFEGSRTIADGIYLDNIHVAAPEIIYASLPFKEDFEQGQWPPAMRRENPHLTAPPETITPAGVVEITDSAAHNGKYALAIGRKVDGKPTTNAIDIYLDMAGEEGIEFSFWMHNNYDDAYPHDGIWLSNNGGKSFVKAYNFNNLATGNYQNIKLDLDSLASSAHVSFTRNFVIRFQQCGSRSLCGNGSFKDGIFLDDILVSKALPVPGLINFHSIEKPACGQYTFTWKPLDEAKAYHLQVMKGTGIGIGNHMIFDAHVSKEKYTLSGLENETTYSWRIRAISDEKTGPWTEKSTFYTGKMPKAIISALSDTIISTGGNVTLQAIKEANYRYRWYRNSTLLPDEKRSTFITNQPGEYSVKVMNEQCSYTTPPIKVVVLSAHKEPALLDTDPASITPETTEIETLQGH